MANHSSAQTTVTPMEHHFVDREHQFDAAKLGMWVFIVNEILFFGGLFCAYIVYRAWHPDLFHQASFQLNAVLGGTNTLVLIASSFTVAMAIRSAQIDNQKGLRKHLLWTIILACVFLVIKAFEYAHKFELGLYPGTFYNPAPEVLETLNHPKANIFFSIYYMLTGVHAIHILIGIGLLISVYVRAGRGRFNSEFYNPVEIVGLYWHLVDLIWIFLFPLLYLIE